MQIPSDLYMSQIQINQKGLSHKDKVGQSFISLFDHISKNLN